MTAKVLDCLYDSERKVRSRSVILCSIKGRRGYLRWVHPSIDPILVIFSMICCSRLSSLQFGPIIVLAGFLRRNYHAIIVVSRCASEVGCQGVPNALKLYNMLCALKLLLLMLYPLL